MRDCDHVGHRVYALRTFANGTVHYCIQCTRCLAIVKTEEHQFRPFIRRDEIPTGKTVYPWINPEDAA
jgi:hypothetical protein